MDEQRVAENLKGKRLAVIGLGKMSGILLRAFLDRYLICRENVAATVRHSERAKQLEEEFGIQVGTDNPHAVRDADLILLGVKPGTITHIIREIGPALRPDQLIISIAASVSTLTIEKELRIPVPVVRAMPNTPCVVGAGMTGLCRGSSALDEHVYLARALFASVGRTVVVDEKHMDAVTGLSASGPAFIFIILESLAEAGVKVGLPRDIATLLAAQTVHGAARMVLETGSHPALLKDAVTTPAGCTIDGILELEEGKLRVTLIKAIVKATQRARELVQSENG